MRHVLVAPLVMLGVLAVACATKERPAETWGQADYAAAGIAATDRPWTNDELVAAVKKLAEIGNDPPEHLPRFQGPKSGAVFAHVIELPSLAALPAGPPIGAHLDRYDAFNALSKRYYKDLTRPASREYIELAGVLLQEAAALSPLLEDLLDSIDANDPTRLTRLEGRAKMYQGWGTMVYGALLIAADLRVPVDDRVELVRHQNAVLPVVFPRFPAETQDRIRRQTASLLDALGNGPLKDTVLVTQKATK